MAVSCFHLLFALPTLLGSSGGSTVLVNAHVLAPEGDVWRDDIAILVQEGHIGALVSAKAPLPAGAERIDLGGMYVIPGLIDLHTHLLLHPYDETSWDDQVLRESIELRTIRATVAAPRRSA